ncbi:MAG TPA: putative quinol monooxygenase [Blastocatellia bacterium]|nr:putative quinol monooxygenase [Blastocatellia bacterium]
MIVVVATMRAKEGKEDNLRDVLMALVVESRQEKGCLQYDLMVGDEEPLEFAMYERWESPAALNTHLRSRHIEVAYDMTDDLVDGKARVVSYVQIEPVRTRHTGPTRRLGADEEPG